MDVISLPHQRVASQPIPGTIRPAALQPLWTDHPPWERIAAMLRPMTAPPTRKLVIKGLTSEGKPFRPSDWAERLAGAMSSFRPDGASGGIGAYIGYSPLCVPRRVDGVSSVIVDEALREVEPMAWDFVMNFARDNKLVVEEPDAPPAS